MWEWTKKGKKTSSSTNKSLKKAYSSVVPLTKTLSQTQVSTKYSISEMNDCLLKKIANLGLNNLQLKLLDYKPLSWERTIRFYEEHMRSRKAFLKIIGYSHKQDCLSIGLDEQDILLLKQSISPENFNVHIKIPFDFGGTPTLDNFCFIKSHPTHDKIHHLIEYQIESGFFNHHKKLFIPYLEGVIYTV